MIILMYCRSKYSLPCTFYAWKCKIPSEK